MTMERYETEVLDEDDDDGTMPASLDALREAVVGHRIVNFEHTGGGEGAGGVITLDDGKRVQMIARSDCDRGGWHHGRVHDLAHLRRRRGRAGTHGRVVVREPVLLRLRLHHHGGWLTGS